MGGWLARPGVVRLAASTALLAVALLIVGLGLRKIWTVDYWWQWKTGEHVARHGVPESDVFSYTNLGAPRLEVRWAYTLALYQLTSAFGHGAAVVAKTGLVLVTFLLAALAGPWRRAPVFTAAVAAVAALAASQRFFVRPEVVSYLLFAAFLLVLERARARPTRWVWVLPGLQVLWANVHGLFLLGPALCGAWLVSEAVHWLGSRARGRAFEAGRMASLRTSALLVGATLLASAVNPYGARLFSLPLLQFSALHGTVQKGLLQELTSPFAFDQGWTALFYYKVLIGAVAVSILLNLRRQQLYWLLVVGSQLYLSATAIRNLPFFALAAVPFVVRNVVESPVRERPGVRRLLPAAGTGLAVLVVVFCLHQARELLTNRFHITQGDTNRFGIGVAEHRFPLRATAFLRATGVEGPLFNTLGFGSYLIAEGFRVFVDPRAEEHMHRVFGEYREILERPEAFDEHARRYGLRAALLQTEMLPMIEAMRRRPGWRLVHADEVAVLFLREDVAPEVPALDLAAGGDSWFDGLVAGWSPPVAYESRGFFTPLDSPVPYERLASFCALLGQVRCAAQALAWAERAYPPGFTQHGALAFYLASRGDLAAAVPRYEAAIGRSEAVLRESRRTGTAEAVSAATAELRNLRTRLAVVLVQLGRNEQARPWVESLLAADPRDAEARALMGVLELADGRGAEAERWLTEAIAIAPDGRGYRKHLARALSLQGRWEEARLQFAAAWGEDPGDFGVARDLAGTLAQLGLRDEARLWVERAAALRPQDPLVGEMRRALDGGP